jgi:N-acetyl-gamma-glutamyl-phosphate reductase
MFKVFIDGHEGTTGLQIHDRLADRPDIELLQIPSHQRKDPAVKKRFIGSADIVILCLPDDAARESAALAERSAARIIDASTVHRTAAGWVYGFPELERGQRGKIAAASRVSVPGCHATGLVAAVAPLVKRGIIPPDYPMSCWSLTGYSGGGKKMIAAYESGGPLPVPLRAPRPYALTLQHKHVPEMKQWTGLHSPPLFMPVVGNFYQGMAVSVPLHTRLLNGTPDPNTVHSALSEHYSNEPFIRVLPLGPVDSLDNGFLDPTGCNGTNRLDIFVFGNREQIHILSRFDNLGKGASGAAVQNLNIMLGIEETAGLAVFDKA